MLAFGPDQVATHQPSVEMTRIVPADDVHVFHHPRVLGTRLNLLIHARDQDGAERAAMSVQAEIQRLAAVLNWRDPASELYRLNKAPEHAASADLFTVIAAAEQWRGASDGAYSGRLGRVLEPWRTAEAAAPERARLEDLALAAAQADVALDADARLIRRPDAVRFDLDGIAKGYIVDRALAAALAGPGVSGALLDIGGDIRCAGPAPDGGAWPVALPAPLSPYDNAPLVGQLPLLDQAVATSGLGPRDRTIGGRRYGSTLDPRTGWPLPRQRSASVLAGSAMDADALATALLVLPTDAGAELAAASGARGRVTQDGRSLWLNGAAPGWTPIQNRRPAPAAQAGRWPERWVAFVTFSAPPKQMRRQLAFRSPYVAIWVSDAQNRHVRTLFLVGSIKEYQRDNYVWWGLNRANAMELVSTRSFSTRGSGEYKVLWDGIDEAGKTVPAGRYILHVETSREEGAHTHRTLDIDASQARAWSLETPMSEEAGQLSVSFGKF